MNKPKYGMGLDEFLGHSIRSGGSSLYLKNWRKDDPHKIMVWLVKSAGFIARWTHGFPKIVVREDRHTGDITKEVWMGNGVCWEKEVILKKQMYRDDDNQREYPPVICPMCRAIEYVYQQIAAGELNWTDEIFKFEGDDPSKSIVIHAGGFCGMFQESRNKPFSPKQKADLRRARIQPSEAWKENSIAKCQYVFTVVDHAHPENGAQITTEANALGMAMQTKIRDVMESKGRTEGNPLITPYAFQWEYREDQPFDKKYRVVPMERIQLTEEIEELIDGEPPDLTEYLTPLNAIQMKSDFEQYALIEFPLDEIFGDAIELQKKREAKKDSTVEEEEKPKARTRTPEVRTTSKAKAREDDSFDDELEEEAEEKPKARTASSTSNVKRFPSKKVEEPEESEAEEQATKAVTRMMNASPKKAKEQPKKEEEQVECDHCGHAMNSSDVECSECGALYDENGITARPCTNCSELIELDGSGKVICSKCGSIHNVETWKVENESKPTPKRTRGSKTSNASQAEPAAKAANEAAVEKVFNEEDDDLPWQSGS